MIKHLLMAILFFSFLSARAQTGDTTFKKQWTEIDRLIIEKKLPKSALVKVKNLYKLAKDRKLPAQLLKTVLYRISLEEETNDQKDNTSVTLLEKEMAATSDVVTKSALQLLLARNYVSIYSNDSWKYNNRSAVVNYKPNDIGTWNKQNFEAKVDSLLEGVFRSKKLLQQVSIKEMAAVVIKGHEANLRPTLYDLMAFDAIDFSTRFVEVGYSTQMPFTDTAAMENTANFMHHTFSKRDTVDFAYVVLNIFQEVLKFHQHDKDRSAFIDADIQRVVWGNDHLHFFNKEALYPNALLNIIQQNGNALAADQAWYLLAKYHKEQANKYSASGDTTNRFENVLAMKLIDERLQEQKLASSGKSNLQELKKEILYKEINSKVEKVNVPNQPFRLYVEYRNTDTLYYRIAKLKQHDPLDKYYGTQMEIYTQLPVYRKAIQLLPDTRDYQKHSVEIKVDGLPVGSYLLLASTGKNFIDSTDRMFAQTFSVSALSYIQNGKDHFVLDRETGKPLENVTVKVNTSSWDKNQSKYVRTVLGIFKTDKNGFATFSKLIKTSNSYSLELIKGTDTLQDSGSEYYNDYSTNNDRIKNAAAFEKKNAKAFFFTDRSIYRPGQTLYYKALLTTNDSATSNHKIYRPKNGIKLFLYNVNNKKIDSVKLVPNEYGSVNGSFKLPQAGLTGNYYIRIDGINGEANFNVEEYKRPTFFIEFEKQLSTYRLNDSIKAIGYVKSYAGAAISNAAINFTVNRNSIYTYSWYSRKQRPYNDNSTQIMQGKLVTDETGKFTIHFKARPDATIDNDSSTIFNFSIQASVTDINGETREETNTVSVGYQSMTISTEIPSIANAANFKKFPVETRNLAYEKVRASVHIRIVALQTPERATRKRYWETPDQFVMNEKEFINYFPYDEYKNETDHTEWKWLNTVSEGTVNTPIDSFYVLNKTLPQGWYAIELTAKDSFGVDVKTVTYTELYQAEQPSLPAPAYNWVHESKTIVAPGDTASLLIGSTMKDVFIIQNTKRVKGIQNINAKEESSYSFATINDNKINWQQRVTEKDRGVLGMYYAFVKHNRFYDGGTRITIPYDNKLLDISYSSYRNKTEPGSKETWSVKIKSSKDEKVAAELLTAMYDASLDQFARHDWQEPTIWYESPYFHDNWNGSDCFVEIGSEENDRQYFDGTDDDKYSRLAESGSALWWLNSSGTFLSNGAMNGNVRILENSRVRMGLQGKASGIVTNGASYSFIAGNAGYLNVQKLQFAASTPVADSARFTYMLGFDEEGKANGLNAKNPQPKIQPRKNFSETAFFFPNLYADTAGNYTFSFTMPEALTQWKWMSFAHTKDLAFGTNSTTITTQKTLMVQPNAPRFMREGDNMEFVAKVSNMSDKELTGQATLELVDAVTGNSVDGWFQNVFPNQYFTVAAGQSAAVKFPIQIPFSYNKPLTWRVVAKAGEFSDGEENTLPVLTNRMLVTETLPLYLKPGEKEKSFAFDKLLNNKSESLTNEAITVEYTANPIWSVVQSLPYLMEYPYECAEQTFNRLFANALAAGIVNKRPKIKAMFDAWGSDTTALKSNLQKNEELKQVLLQETPWVLEAESEEQQKKNIALLFDVVKMGNNIETIIEKLKQMQLPSGGFAWFKGGREDRYITNYIMTGIGKLKTVNILSAEQADQLMPVFKKALQYLDDALQEDYANLKKRKVDMSKQQIGSTEIQYLYMRSFFVTEIKNKEAYNYYYNQAKLYWNKQNTYHAALIGIVLYRNNEKRFVNVNILPSILENTIEDTAKGTLYWKERNTCFWYVNPIEHQSAMINLLEEIGEATGNAELNRTLLGARAWLLLNKQTNNWKTTVATADACYALMNNRDDMLNSNQQVQIKLGTQTIVNQQQNSQPETPNPKQQTGYIKQRIAGGKVQPSMGNIHVTVEQLNNQTIKPSSPSYGSIYWQYFEDLDKITAASSPLSIQKKLFIETNTDKGKVLEPVSDTNQLKVGDKLIVRMELRTDREMEYLHLKDMRASGTEPINVLSGYKWQEGLGYYEATKDASTNFFIDHMQKGTYLFEYPLYITHTGTFSMGIATIQCMYAPEFTSHSEGLKITVKE